jgi:hypothetical protein
MKFCTTFCQLTRNGHRRIKFLYSISLLGCLMAIASETGQAVHAQESPSAQQVVDACVTDRVTTLPNPYSDVASEHWAYEAVLKMHYCGVIRPGLPATLIERLTGVRPSQDIDNDATTAPEVP